MSLVMSKARVELEVDTIMAGLVKKKRCKELLNECTGLVLSLISRVKLSN